MLVFVSDTEPYIEIIDPTEERYKVEFGKPFTLKCVGHMGSNLHWYHNGSQLLGSSHIIITSSHDIQNDRQASLLTRNSVKAQDSGWYECRDGNTTNVSDRVTVVVSLSETRKGINRINCSTYYNALFRY